MKEIENIGRGELWRFIFLHNTKSFSFGENKIVLEEGLSVLE